MKIKQTVYLMQQMQSWDTRPNLVILNADVTDACKEYFGACSLEVEFEVPDDYHTQAAAYFVEKLKGDRKSAMAEAMLKDKERGEQIQSLLALDAPKEDEIPF